jgi:hypothetical protein
MSHLIANTLIFHTGANPLGDANGSQQLTKPGSASPSCSFHLTAVERDKLPLAPCWVENDFNEINRVRLIINMPPRHLKSFFASVAFPGLVSRA